MIGRGSEGREDQDESRVAGFSDGVMVMPLQERQPQSHHLCSPLQSENAGGAPIKKVIKNFKVATADH